jgi:hypothetical protein
MPIKLILQRTDLDAVPFSVPLMKGNSPHNNASMQINKMILILKIIQILGLFA